MFTLCDYTISRYGLFNMMEVSIVNRKEKDMCLPDWICCLGIFLIIAALVCLVLCFTVTVFALLGFIVFLSLGAAAVLCWKNQGAVIADEESFIYTTMFGTEKRYRFSDIREIQQNTDSLTLILSNGKVHIESCAVMSERFMNALGHASEEQ